MRNRKSRSGSEQPSLQPLLQSAQRSEKHEDEDDMSIAEMLFDFPRAPSDQYDAQRNSTAPSTKPEELPEMETGKEVAVQSVNLSLQGKGGEERVTSMANSLEVNGDVGMEKQGEGSEELTGLAMPSAIAIGELPGASILHPVLIEESESDSELPSWLRPSKAPEGSLLHTLYLQLVGAGRDGITVRELFKCFKKPAEVLSFESDWKVQVQWHLKTNPHFCEAKGYHYLLCNDPREVQQPKHSPANIASTSSRYGAYSSKTVLTSQRSTPAALQIGLSVDTHEGVVQNRRTAFQKATEFEEMHQSMADMQMPSSVADPIDSQLVSHGPLWMSRRKRKSPSSDDEELPHHGHPIPGGLQATQAEIFAKTEVQTGRRCVIQKDDTGNSRCNMMALAGHSLCNHHWSLQLQEDGRTSLSPNQGSRKHLTAFKPWIAPAKGVTTRVQCGHRHKSKDGIRSSQCSRVAMRGYRLCEDHKQLREEREARQRADATIFPPISREDTLSRTEAAKDVDKRAVGVSNHDDDSNGEHLQQQMPKNVPKRHHVSARKTAANVGPLKSQSLIRTPTIPPLPPPYGIRRKTPVKNRDQ